MKRKKSQHKQPESQVERNQNPQQALKYPMEPVATMPRSPKRLKLEEQELSRLLVGVPVVLLW